MKKRILFANEFSGLFTGYAKYGREILSRIYQTDKYEIVELASYVGHEDPRLSEVPWGICPVLPCNDEEKRQYESNAINQFGKYKFETLCVQYKPHIVMNIRDPWMMEYMFTSPYRDFYNLVIMPTVDGTPQHEQWLEMYKEADGVFTYQDWSGKILQEEGGYRINYLGSASPSSNPTYRIQSLEEKNRFKQAFGLEGYKIIGTIMRNQKRKLYPELFKSFRKYLDESGRTDVLLYCHTSYPDYGWDIPKLLNKNGIASKVLFSYSCEKCGYAYPTLFMDALISCPNCSQFSCGMCNTKRGMTDEMLCCVINSFDLYVQYSTCEGFGIGLVEAASCGVPVCGTDYSAMEDVIRKLGGFPLKVKSKQIEMETGRYIALPDNRYFVNLLHEYFNQTDEQINELKIKTRKNFEENYNWQATANKWMEYFDSVDTDHYEKMWKSPPRIHETTRQINSNCSNKDFSDWLIREVLGMPEKIGSFMQSRLIRDLNYGVSIGGIGGSYFNEMSEQYSENRYFSFGRQDAYEHFATIRNDMNQWERIRTQ